MTDASVIAIGVESPDDPNSNSNDREEEEGDENRRDCDAHDHARAHDHGHVHDRALVRTHVDSVASPATSHSMAVYYYSPRGMATVDKRWVNMDKVVRDERNLRGDARWRANEDAYDPSAGMSSSSMYDYSMSTLVGSLDCCASIVDSLVVALRFVVPPSS